MSNIKKMVTPDHSDGRVALKLCTGCDTHYISAVAQMMSEEIVFWGIN